MSQNQGPSLPRSFSGSLKGQLACPNLPRALMSWEGSKSELICYLGEMGDREGEAKSTGSHGCALPQILSLPHYSFFQGKEIINMY